MLVESNSKSRAMIRTRKGIKNTVYLMGKRLIDLLISLTLLILVMPALLFIGYWVYKQEGAPILHRQRRTGKQHQAFMMWTFRTVTNTSNMIRSLPTYHVPDSWYTGVTASFAIISY